MADEPRKRRLTRKDQQEAVTFVYDTLQERKANKFRQQHEEIWKSVDKQIAMQPPATVNRSGNPDEDWHNAIQLGLLADALEIIASDVNRLTFPSDRQWFAPHVNLPVELDPQTGEAVVDRKRQKATDGVLRSLMAQQHSDFGLKDRVKLSVKESLTHGGMVVIAKREQMAKFHGGSGSQALSAPVWQPYSMWNCYPDHGEHIIGTDLIYRGSMIITWKLQYGILKRMKNWMNLDRITKPKASDEVELITYYGDLNITRSQGQDMFLPNRMTVFADKEMVFSEVNEMPYQPVIYTGYERDDVRDPYYTSPLIKRAPTAKLATHSANKFLDLVDLKTEPPIAYEKHDTFFAANQGPEIAPGAKNPTTGAANLKIIETGDPNTALAGLQFAITETEKGTGSNAVRQGVSDGNEMTATEIVKAEQRGELRTVDFVGVLERQGLKPFLYMQHELNLLKLNSYPVYNDEINTQDFLVISASDLKKREAHFEIVGSRELLGEEQRVARFRETALFAVSNEQFASRTDVDEVLKQMWQDARVKEPERFLLNADPDMEEKLEQVTAEFQEQLAAMQAELEKFQLMDERHGAEIAQKDLRIQQEVTDKNTFRETNRILMETRQAEDRLRGIQKQLEKQRDAIPEGGEGREQIEASIADLAGAIADAEEAREARRQKLLNEIRTIAPDVAKAVQ